MKRRPMKKKKEKNKKMMMMESSTQKIELPEEVILEILIRLPVKSLLRFKPVSKAWRTTISDDPSFIRAHLQHHASQWKHNPSLLITPHALRSVIKGEKWPTTFSTQIRFYQWQPTAAAASVAKLMHGQDFGNEFSSVCQFAHCDGLVLLPTNTKVYLFNPATRDALTLPDETNPNKIPVPPDVFLPAGLGLDPRTGKYKVVRAFYRSMDPLTKVFHMGMQVYTIGDKAWRDMLKDPPYPVVEWTTPKYVKGHMFWVIDTYNNDIGRRRCLLRLDLEDETFGVTSLPASLDPALDEAFMLDVMHGELCLNASASAACRQPQAVWVLVHEEGMSSRWEQRYSIPMTQGGRPMALLADDTVMWYSRRHLYRYRRHTSEPTEVVKMDGLRYERRRAGTYESVGKNVFFFNVMPYMESLVRLSA